MTEQGHTLVGDCDEHSTVMTDMCHCVCLSVSPCHARVEVAWELDWESGDQLCLLPACASSGQVTAFLRRSLPGPSHRVIVRISH